MLHLNNTDKVTLTSMPASHTHLIKSDESSHTHIVPAEVLHTFHSSVHAVDNNVVEWATSSADGNVILLINST